MLFLIKRSVNQVSKKFSISFGTVQTTGLFYITIAVEVNSLFHLTSTLGFLIQTKQRQLNPDKTSLCHVKLQTTT